MDKVLFLFYCSLIKQIKRIFSFRTIVTKKSYVLHEGKWCKLTKKVENLKFLPKILAYVREKL